MLTEVADLQREIREYGGSVDGVAARGHSNARHPRGGRASTMPQALAPLLKGKTMSVTDAAEAVQRAGYTTNSPNFRVIVNATLLREKVLFKRMGRGLYTAKCLNCEMRPSPHLIPMLPATRLRRPRNSRTAAGCLVRAASR